MALSFIHLVEASVLLLNAMGILNEKRVLRPLGLDKPNYSNTFKSKLSLLFHSERLPGMKAELEGQNLGDSLTYKTENIKNGEHERELIINMVLLLSGYQSKLFETHLSEKERNRMGVCPKIVRVCPEVEIDHPSREAFKSLLNEIAKFGSAINAVYRLNEALENSYKDARNSEDKKLPHSLITLFSESEDCESEPGRRKYDWDWKEDLGGLCKAIKLIVQDWRFIMFSVQRKLVKTGSESEKDQELSIRPASHEEEIKSPIVEIMEKNEIYFSEENGVLDIYTKMEPFFRVFENVANLMETFLNYTEVKQINKKEMANVILILLIIKSRNAEMNNEGDLVGLYRYLIYYTFKDKRDYILSLRSEKIFAVFEEPIRMIREVSESISHLDPENAAKNIKILHDDELKESLLKMYNNREQSVEMQFFEYLNGKIRKFLPKGIDMISTIINEKHKYRHYLHILNTIALRQMPDSEFERRTLLRDRKVKSILVRGVKDLMKRNELNLEELKPKELEHIMSTLQIEVNPRNQYTITLKNKENVGLFSSEDLKTYSEIFDHMTEFAIFRRNMDKLVSEHKWTNLRKSSKNLVKTMLMMINMNNAMTLYYSQVIEHFAEKINELTKGTRVEEIRKGHENKMVVLRTYLLVPMEEDKEELWSPKIKKISENIKIIFKILKELTLKEVSVENFNEETYKKVKDSYDEVVKTMDEGFVDYMVNYAKWRIFEGNRGGLGGLLSEKEELGRIILTFRSLLSFSCK